MRAGIEETSNANNFVRSHRSRSHSRGNFPGKADSRALKAEITFQNRLPSPNRKDEGMSDDIFRLRKRAGQRYVTRPIDCADIFGGKRHPRGQVSSSGHDLRQRVLSTAESQPFVKEISDATCQDGRHRQRYYNSSQCRKSPPPKRRAHAIQCANGNC